MSTTNKTGRLSLGAGVLAAIASSICCIGPLVAGIAGISGAASAFSWIDPLRPYLIGFTVLALGFAFYQAYRPAKEEADCCAVENGPARKPFYQKKGFLWVMTVFAIGMLTFPYYSGVFYAQSPRAENSFAPQNGIQKVTFEVEGMTCTGCEHHIEGDLNKTEGVVLADADYDKGNTVVSFNPDQVSKEKIVEVINGTGYTVKSEIKNDQPE